MRFEVTVSLREVRVIWANPPISSDALLADNVAEEIGVAVVKKLAGKWKLTEGFFGGGTNSQRWELLRD